MNKKILIVTGILTVFSILFVIFSRSENIRTREPVTIEGFASIEEVSLDGLISESDLIVIGKVDSNLPSRWNTADGKLPESVTMTNLGPDYVIFTDQLFLPNRIIKGEHANLIRIRHFGGQVDNDTMTISAEVSLDINTNYLLFLIEDTLGSTAEINAGHHIILGSIQGVYKIEGDKAISYRDEWYLEDLIAYIEKLFSGDGSSLILTSTPTESLVETP